MAVTTLLYADARMPVAMTKAGTTYYLAYDQVGSLKVVADASGSVIRKPEYDTFGNVISDSDPSFAMPFGFAGGLHDTDTDLVRFGHRDYDPETGRWTAKDPILFAGGDTDLYGYCVNDPVKWIDPSGMLSFGGGVVGGVIGAIGGAINAAVNNADTLTGAMIGGLGGFVGGMIDGGLGITAGAGAVIGAIAATATCANPGGMIGASLAGGIGGGITGLAIKAGAAPALAAIAAGTFIGSSWGTGFEMLGNIFYDIVNKGNEYYDDLFGGDDACVDSPSGCEN